MRFKSNKENKGEKRKERKCVNKGVCRLQHATWRLLYMQISKTKKPIICNILCTNISNIFDVSSKHWHTSRHLSASPLSPQPLSTTTQDNTENEGQRLGKPTLRRRQPLQPMPVRAAAAGMFFCHISSFYLLTFSV
jgi:hypothetical protein